MSERGYSKSRKTVTRAIRVDEDLDKNLGEIAIKEGTSVNFVVNRALQKFVEWDYLASKYGITSNFTAALTKLLDYLPDEQVVDFARWVAGNLFKEYVTFWFKSVSLENIVRAIRLLGVAGNFRYDESFDSDVRSIVCKHNSGRKWSRFYAEVFARVFEDLGETRVKIESTENQVLVQFTTTKEAYLEPFYDSLQKHKSGR
jgi:hypothetical protein